MFFRCAFVFSSVFLCLQHFLFFLCGRKGKQQKSDAVGYFNDWKVSECPSPARKVPGVLGARRRVAGESLL